MGYRSRCTGTSRPPEQDESVAISSGGSFRGVAGRAWSGRSSPESTAGNPSASACAVHSLAVRSREKKRQRHTRHDAKPDKGLVSPHVLNFRGGTETLVCSLRRIGTTLR